MRKYIREILLTAVIICMGLTGCSQRGKNVQDSRPKSEVKVEIGEEVVTLDNIPEFSDSPYVAIENNVPNFDSSDFKGQSFETYSGLDELGRCGTAYACIGKDLMPTEKRGNIGMVKPSGWQTVKYDGVDGKYLYNRCHLIGYQLTAENANEKNLITGTRYMNVDGMLPFENMVADYIKETGNHVFYRVTPVFEGTALVAKGVEMEAQSVEDDGEGILYHVFVYNNQPGITIDYQTGKSWENEKEQQKEANSGIYVLNKSTKKFHKNSCSSVTSIKSKNLQNYEGSRDDLIKEGYEACKNCNP